MDKIRGRRRRRREEEAVVRRGSIAFRSIPGYAGHVPSSESYLSKGVRKNGLDIPRALRSLLDEGVEEAKLTTVLDKNGTGWLDKDKVTWRL